KNLVRLLSRRSSSGGEFRRDRHAGHLHAQPDQVFKAAPAAKEFDMKRFVMCVLSVMAVLAVAKIAAAAPQLPTPKLPRAPLNAGTLGDVEMDGRVVGSIRLVASGQVNVITLASGHRVSVRMQNGRAVSGLAVDARGTAVPVEVSNDVARRIIIV